MKSDLLTNLDCISFSPPHNKTSSTSNCASPLPSFPACNPILPCSCGRISQEAGLQQEEIEVKTARKEMRNMGIGRKATAT